MIWDHRPHRLKHGSGFPRCRFADDHYQALLADRVAKFVIDLPGDV
jgi:hypothetical protein